MAGNAATLYLAHFLGMVVPLITVPYLARVLRPEGWGLVLIAQSFGAWLVLVHEYGFDLSGTRAVARVRGDRAGLISVVSGIQSAKFLVLVMSAPIIPLVLFVFPPLRHQPEYVLWAWLFAVARGLSPNWYFFGHERMAPAALFDAAARILAALGIFFLVKAPEDGWRVLALQTGAMAVAVLVMTGLMRMEVPRKAPRLGEGLRTLREGAGVFLFRGASGLYMQANPFILGLLAPAPVVAFFAGAEKIVRAAIGLLQPLSQTLFPRVSSLIGKDDRGARRLFRFSFVGIIGLGLGMGLAAFFFAEPLVRIILGPGYEGAVPILRFLSLLPPIIGFGTVFGIQWALPAGLERPFYLLVIWAGLLNLILAFILVPRFGATGMAASVLSAEFLVAGGLVRLFLRKGGTFIPLSLPPVRPFLEG